jgi:hypothetical protein
MPYCWKCGTEFKEDAKFCQKCGVPIGRRITRLRKSEWVYMLGAFALGTFLLFGGSVFFYWGAWNHLMGYGVRGPPMWLFMFFGGCIIIGGIYVSSYLGKKLKGKYLAAIALMHLIAAPSLIYLIFSLLDPHYVNLFMSPIILSNIALDIAFLVGYLIRKR